MPKRPEWKFATDQMNHDLIQAKLVDYQLAFPKFSNYGVTPNDIPYNAMNEFENLGSYTPEEVGTLFWLYCKLRKKSYTKGEVFRSSEWNYIAQLWGRKSHRWRETFYRIMPMRLALDGTYESTW